MLNFNKMAVNSTMGIVMIINEDVNEDIEYKSTKMNSEMIMNRLRLINLDLQEIKNELVKLSNKN